MMFILFILISSINHPFLQGVFGAGQASAGGVSILFIDPASLIFNPASAHTGNGLFLGAGYNNNFSGFRDSYLTFSYGKDGLSYLCGFLYSGAEDVRTSNGEISVYSLLLTQGIAAGWEGFTGGAAFSLLREDFGLIKGSGYTFTGSIIKELRGFRLGFTLRNLYGFYKIGERRERLREEARFSFGGIFRSLHYGIEGVFKRGDRPEYHAGIDLNLLNILDLRIGFRNGPQDAELGYFTYGIGVRVKGIELNFAYIPYGILGNTKMAEVVYRGIPMRGLTRRKRGVLSIILVDSTSGVPLDSVLVGCAGAARGESYALNGRANFRIESDGWIYIRALKEGYNFKSDSILVRKGEHYVKRILLRAKKRATLIIQVLKSRDFEPLAGTVKLSGPMSIIKTKDTLPLLVDYILQGRYKVKFQSAQFSGEGEVDVEVDTVFFTLFAREEGEPLLLFVVPFKDGSADIGEEGEMIIKKYAGILLKAKKIYIDAVSPPCEKVENHEAIAQKRLLVTYRYLLDNYGLEASRIYTNNRADGGKALDFFGKTVIGRVEVRVE